MDSLRETAQMVLAQVNQVLLGKEAAVEEVFLTFLASGHVLLEDIPGVGKTMLALAFSKAMQLDFRRVQFTPDVMPSDLTGFSVYRRNEDTFVYQPGSVFCNLLLADEINRASPKTQSALLEVMEERQVSVEGTTRQVPQPFLVIATQNPPGTTGTQHLPEAQVDRFMTSVTLGYPDFEHELAMAMAVKEHSRLDGITPVMEKDGLLQIQRAIHQVYMKENVYRYLLELITATRANAYLERGASPRATIALVKLSKAAAWLHGNEYVTPNDVAGQFLYVVCHRLLLNTAARMENRNVRQIAEDIQKTVKKPPLGEKNR